jgi:hypothetical protein
MDAAPSHGGVSQADSFPFAGGYADPSSRAMLTNQHPSDRMLSDGSRRVLRRRFLFDLMLVTGFALALRLWASAMVVSPSVDAVKWVRAAETIRRDGLAAVTQLDVHPLFPVILELVERPLAWMATNPGDGEFARWWLAARLVNVVASVVGVIGAWLALRAWMGPKDGLYAGLIAACLPKSVQWSSDIMADPLLFALTALASAALVTSLVAANRHRPRRPHPALFAFGAGLCSGLAWLTKSDAIILLGAAGLTWFVALIRAPAGWSRQIVLWRAVAFGLGTVVIAGPYVAAMGRLSPRPNLATLEESAGLTRRSSAAEASRPNPTETLAPGMGRTPVAGPSDVAGVDAAAAEARRNEAVTSGESAAAESDRPAWNCPTESINAYARRPLGVAVKDLFSAWQLAGFYWLKWGLLFWLIAGMPGRRRPGAVLSLAAFLVSSGVLLALSTSAGYLGERYLLLPAALACGPAWLGLRACCDVVTWGCHRVSRTLNGMIPPTVRYRVGRTTALPLALGCMSAAALPPHNLNQAAFPQAARWLRREAQGGRSARLIDLTALAGRLADVPEVDDGTFEAGGSGRRLILVEPSHLATHERERLRVARLAPRGRVVASFPKEAGGTTQRMLLLIEPAADRSPLASAPREQPSR